QRKSNKAKGKKLKRLEERAALDAVCARVESANKLDDPLAAFPVFKKYDRNGLNLVIECQRVSMLKPGTLDWAYELTRANMQTLCPSPAQVGEGSGRQGSPRVHQRPPVADRFCSGVNQICPPALYEQSEWGWKDREKRDEMTDDRAWYLTVRDADSSPLAFSHFRFDVECGEEVLYCYEVQLESRVRRKGLGKFLIQILQLIANRHSRVVWRGGESHSQGSAGVLEGLPW
ncbi:NAA40 acetyltransferase, partial [Polyodon spathula]|nr:NAA40 acetyltransferase [Polyodon spathula]